MKLTATINIFLGLLKQALASYQTYLQTLATRERIKLEEDNEDLTDEIIALERVADPHQRPRLEQLRQRLKRRQAYGRELDESLRAARTAPAAGDGDSDG